MYGEGCGEEIGSVGYPGGCIMGAHNENGIIYKQSCLQVVYCRTKEKSNCWYIPKGMGAGHRLERYQRTSQGAEGPATTATSILVGCYFGACHADFCLLRGLLKHLATTSAAK
eukprot:388049-Pelagomonas_calceolata.AAC.5